MQSEYYQDPDVVVLNSGSFGLPPKCIFQAKQKYLEQYAQCPDRFFRVEYPQLLKKSAQVVASYFHADPEGILFFDNVTCVIDSVLKCWDLGPGRNLLLTSTTYGTITLAAIEEAKQRNFQVHVLTIDLPIESDDELLRLYENALKEFPDVKYAIVDHITSYGSIVFPVQQITHLLQEQGVTVLVDGAHAYGQILHLNLTHINAEFYTGNLHKWFFALPGTAMMYVRDEADRNILRPRVLSWKHNEPSLLERFSWVGPRDGTNYCVIPDIVQFIERFGGEVELYHHRANLMKEALQYLRDELQMHPIPVPHQAPFLTTLFLPEVFQTHADVMDKLSIGTLQVRMHSTLMYEYGVNVLMLRLRFTDHFKPWCLRISVNLHNTMSDFETLVKALRRFADDIVAGKYFEEASNGNFD